MRYTKCCVPGCINTRQNNVLHKFPNCENRRNLWLKSINSDSLRSLSLFEISTKFVCHVHFEARFLTEKSRLVMRAYPTLFTELELSTGIQTHSKSEIQKLSSNPRLEHNYCHRLHCDHNYAAYKPTDSQASANTDLHELAADKDNETTAADNCNETPTPDICNELLEQETLGEAHKDIVIEDDEVLQDLVYEDSPISIKDDDTMEDLVYEDSPVSIKDDDVIEDLTSTDFPIQAEKSLEDVESDLHVGYKCNVCESDIRGYVCVQCSDWDMCGGCEARGAHSQHYVLRLPGARPQNEIQSILDRIRRELMELTVFIDERIKEEKDDEHTEDPLHEVPDITEEVKTSSELLNEQLNELENFVYLEDVEIERNIQNDTQETLSNITNTPLSASFSGSNITSSEPSTRVSASINTSNASSARHSVCNIISTNNFSSYTSDNTCCTKSSNSSGPRLKKKNFKVTQSTPIVRVERTDLNKIMFKFKSSQNSSPLRIIKAGKQN